MGPYPEPWRAVEDAPEPRLAGRSEESSAEPSRTHGPLLIAGVLLVCGVMAIAGVVLVAWSAAPSEVVIGGAEVAGFDVSRPLTSSDPSGAGRADVLPPPAPDLIVDVEGAVERPGLYRVPAGSRVGDAIAAAGGFGVRVDAVAAAQALNLAAPLVDGDKVSVPALGDALAVPPGPSAASAPTAAALIDLNTADSVALETLPGIGPVTAGEIIAARATQPFVSVDDVLARGVVGPSTFEKIRLLVTVGG
jgi:competence protein ComEA